MLGILALLIGLYCIWQIYSINKLRSTFFAGSKAISLEDIILTLQNQLNESQTHLEFVETALNELKKDFGFAVQKVGLVRFNPFNDGGGNFSFTIALLDQHDSGVIITSMYGREQNRIYTKRILQGKYDSQLTEEELQAIQQANSKIESLKPKPASTRVVLSNIESTRGGQNRKSKV